MRVINKSKSIYTQLKIFYRVVGNFIDFAQFLHVKLYRKQKIYRKSIIFSTTLKKIFNWEIIDFIRQ